MAAPMEKIESLELISKYDAVIYGKTMQETMVQRDMFEMDAMAPSIDT